MKHFRIIEKWLGVSLCSAFILPNYVTSTGQANRRPTRFAIVGAGIGGTSCAYFLHELFQDNALIDVYEKNVVGGRLATVALNGRTFETGGTAIHPRNRYMKDLSQKLGFKKADDCTSSFGLFNGSEYTFRSGSWEFVTIIKLFWRYGWDIYRLESFVKKMLDDFDRIYELQEEGKSYRDVPSFLEAINSRFHTMSNWTTSSWLRKEGLSELIIDELVMAAIQANYGQTLDIHAFVGSIAIAGTDGDLWSVRGGNQYVAEALLTKSEASLLKREVTEIHQADYGTFKIVSRDLEDAQIGDAVYDVVIVATPLTKDTSRIKFVNFDEEKQFEFPGHYEPIYCTIVEGELNEKALKFPQPNYVDNIFVINPSLYFNAVGKLTPVDVVQCGGFDSQVYKIFSPKPLSEVQLHSLFNVTSSVRVTSWLAYPHYNDTHLGTFELSPGLYYLNAIEQAGSAMEMSVIAAKNVALLAQKHFNSNSIYAERYAFKDEL